jgi:hypothetical protein
MSIYEKASLVLNSVNASSINAMRSSFTWNNINLRNLLGDMYDKYDRFNLCLNCISSAYTGSALSGTNNSQVLIRLTGLPWIGCNYNISSTGINANNIYTIITSFKFSSSTPQEPLTQYFNESIATFSKNSDIISITIDYLRLVDLSSPDTTNTYPQVSFIFDIYGIDDYKTNDVSRRIKI